MKVHIEGLNNEAGEFIGYVGGGVCSKSIETLYKYLKPLYHLTSFSDFIYHEDECEGVDTFWLENWNLLTIDVNQEEL